MQDNTAGTVVSLHDTICVDDHSQVRRLSLSTLVVVCPCPTSPGQRLTLASQDLAFVVRRNLERLRILRKGHEVQFEMIV